MFTMIFVRTFLLSTLVKIGTPKFRRFMVDLMPFKNVRKLRDIVDILDGTAVEILEAKRRALREGDEAVKGQIGQGKDVMSVLCRWIGSVVVDFADQRLGSVRANMEASEEDKLPEYEVLGQVVSHMRYIYSSTYDHLQMSYVLPLISCSKSVILMYLLGL